MRETDFEKPSSKDYLIVNNMIIKSSIADFPVSSIEEIREQWLNFDPDMSFAVIDVHSDGRLTIGHGLLRASKIPDQINTKDAIRLDVHTNGCEIVAIHGYNNVWLMQRIVERVSMWYDLNNGPFLYLWMSLENEYPAVFYSNLLEFEHTEYLAADHTTKYLIYKDLTIEEEDL